MEAEDWCECMRKCCEDEDKNGPYAINPGDIDADVPEEDGDVPVDWGTDPNDDDREPDPDPDPNEDGDNGGSFLPIVGAFPGSSSEEEEDPDGDTEDDFSIQLEPLEEGDPEQPAVEGPIGGIDDNINITGEMGDIDPSEEPDVDPGDVGAEEPDAGVEPAPGEGAGTGTGSVPAPDPEIDPGQEPEPIVPPAPGEEVERPTPDNEGPDTPGVRPTMEEGTPGVRPIDDVEDPEEPPSQRPRPNPEEPPSQRPRETPDPGPEPPAGSVSVPIVVAPGPQPELQQSDDEDPFIDDIDETGPIVPSGDRDVLPDPGTEPDPDPDSGDPDWSVGLNDIPDGGDETGGGGDREVLPDAENEFPDNEEPDTHIIIDVPEENGDGQAFEGDDDPLDEEDPIPQETQVLENPTGGFETGVFDYQMVLDTDGDGVVDRLDSDDDNDLIPDDEDSRPRDPDPVILENPNGGLDVQMFVDTDGDGVVNRLDSDDDNDGIPDDEDSQPRVPREPTPPPTPPPATVTAPNPRPPPTPPPGPKPLPDVPVQLSEEERKRAFELMDNVNQLRTTEGKEPLIWDERLQSAALWQAHHLSETLGYYKAGDPISDLHQASDPSMAAMQDRTLHYKFGNWTFEAIGMMKMEQEDGRVTDFHERNPKHSFETLERSEPHRNIMIDEVMPEQTSKPNTHIGAAVYDGYVVLLVGRPDPKFDEYYQGQPQYSGPGDPNDTPETRNCDSISHGWKNGLEHSINKLRRDNGVQMLKLGKNSSFGNALQDAAASQAANACGSTKQIPDSNPAQRAMDAGYAWNSLKPEDVLSLTGYKLQGDGRTSTEIFERWIENPDVKKALLNPLLQDLAVAETPGSIVVMAANNPTITQDENIQKWRDLYNEDPDEYCKKYSCKQSKFVAAGDPAVLDCGFD